jgi:hypothetical protein
VDSQKEIPFGQGARFAFFAASMSVFAPSGHLQATHWWCNGEKGSTKME